MWSILTFEVIQVGVHYSGHREKNVEGVQLSFSLWSYIHTDAKSRFEKSWQPRRKGVLSRTEIWFRPPRKSHIPINVLVPSLSARSKDCTANRACQNYWLVNVYCAVIHMKDNSPACRSCRGEVLAPMPLCTCSPSFSRQWGQKALWMSRIWPQKIRVI